MQLELTPIGSMQVGPESAGAHPGPVCYRKGGYAAITDANLVLGRILPEFFPNIFGPNGELLIPIGSWQCGQYGVPGCCLEFADVVDVQHDSLSLLLTCCLMPMQRISPWTERLLRRPWLSWQSKSMQASLTSLRSLLMR